MASNIAAVPTVSAVAITMIAAAARFKRLALRPKGGMGTAVWLRVVACWGIHPAAHWPTATIVATAVSWRPPPVIRRPVEVALPTTPVVSSPTTTTAATDIAVPVAWRASAATLIRWWKVIALPRRDGWLAVRSATPMVAS